MSALIGRQTEDNMTIFNEHLNIENNKLKGLLMVDTRKATGDRWTMINDVVDSYCKIHPQEIFAFAMQNKLIKESRKNVFAEAEKSDSALRWGCSLPIGLMNKLEEVEPMLFSNKKLFNIFLKKYKAFRVCKKV